MLPFRRPECFGPCFESSISFFTVDCRLRFRRKFNAIALPCYCQNSSASCAVLDHTSVLSIRRRASHSACCPSMTSRQGWQCSPAWVSFRAPMYRTRTYLIGVGFTVDRPSQAPAQCPLRNRSLRAFASPHSHQRFGLGVIDLPHWQSAPISAIRSIPALLQTFNEVGTVTIGHS